MIDIGLLSAVMGGIVILLVLILYFRIQAFIALLIASIAVGLFAGQSPETIVDTVKNGMGGTLGFVAVVVGLGAMFGAILEQSGGAQALSSHLLSVFGEKRAPWAMVLTGFFIAIPVFFDVAFIILVPVVYALQRASKKSLLLYAIPLLAGLAITHAFIPPTPGPVAVADIINAPLGLVIVFGFIVGFPTAFLSGPLFGKYIADKIHIPAPPIPDQESVHTAYPPVSLILSIILVPILLIVCNTVLSQFSESVSPQVLSIVALLGHPFVALIIANLLAWYLLGIRRGYSKHKLSAITTKSMEAAGIIILLTGAGGVFKQMLVDTGAGNMLAEYFESVGLPLFVFAFIAAVLIRVLQGSATVAMITAAGLTAPLLHDGLSDMHCALLVIIIAAGASIFSHVNDSGFWLVGKYLGMDEKNTFRSWTMMTTIIAVSGFVIGGIIYTII